MYERLVDASLFLCLNRVNSNKNIHIFIEKRTLELFDDFESKKN